MLEKLRWWDYFRPSYQKVKSKVKNCVVAYRIADAEGTVGYAVTDQDKDVFSLCVFQEDKYEYALGQLTKPLHTCAVFIPEDKTRHARVYGLLPFLGSLYVKA